MFLGNTAGASVRPKEIIIIVSFTCIVELLRRLKLISRRMNAFGRPFIILFVTILLLFTDLRFFFRFVFLGFVSSFFGFFISVSGCEIAGDNYK
jgi:hypothetical protein